MLLDFVASHFGLVYQIQRLSELLRQRDNEISILTKKIREAARDKGKGVPATGASVETNLPTYNTAASAVGLPRQAVATTTMAASGMHASGFGSMQPSAATLAQSAANNMAALQIPDDKKEAFELFQQSHPVCQAFGLDGRRKEWRGGVGMEGWR